MFQILPGAPIFNVLQTAFGPFVLGPAANDESSSEAAKSKAGTLSSGASGPHCKDGVGKGGDDQGDRRGDSTTSAAPDVLATVPDVLAAARAASASDHGSDRAALCRSPGNHNIDR